MKTIINPELEGKFCISCGKPLRLYRTGVYLADTGEPTYYWTCKRTLCETSLSRSSK